MLRDTAGSETFEAGDRNKATGFEVWVMRTGFAGCPPNCLLLRQGERPERVLPALLVVGTAPPMPEPARSMRMECP